MKCKTACDSPNYELVPIVMASVLDPGGFDYEFDPPLSDDFMCSICHLAFKDPVQTLCGHRFCRECLLEFHRRSRKVCPLDNQEVDVEKVFPDNATKRNILSSRVKCPKKSCDWIGSLSQADNHKEVCQFEEVVCTNNNCTESVIRGNLHRHVTETCSWRSYACAYCKDCFPFCNKEVHELTCRQFPVKCTNGCQKLDTMPREKLQAHLDTVCPLTLVNCFYEDIGCTGKFKRNQLDQHLRSATQSHLELACRKIREQDKKIQNQNEDIGNTKEELKHFKTHQNGYVWKISNFQQTLKKAKEGKGERINSAQFCTAPQGYKLYVGLYPNGHGIGKGTNLSVYVYILKGEYDAILPWPCTKEVIFTIIDQQENLVDRENIKKSVRFPKENTKISGRPTGLNNGYGCPKLASHEELGTRKYVVDDTLFLRVDISD